MIFIMQLLKANVSKSSELQQKVCIWLENNNSFQNVYQALTHDDELSLKLFHEEVLIAVGFVTSCRSRYFTRHCFFVEDTEIIDVTFDTLHKLEVREYSVVKLYTFTQYLEKVGYEPNNRTQQLNLNAL